MLDPLTGYPALLKEIKERIRSAQYEALKSVNKELISLYWDIGRVIIERQKGQRGLFIIKWKIYMLGLPLQIHGERLPG